MTLSGWLVCGVAIVVLLIAAVGIIRLPDALARQHAATKAVTLALLLFILGVGLVAQEGAWNWRLLALTVILLVTLPLASHALARAGVAETITEQCEKRVPLETTLECWLNSGQNNDHAGSSGNDPITVRNRGAIE